MNITVNGIPVCLEQGQTIHDAVVKLGLESKSLRKRPLAAQIGGEVYSLRYAPRYDSEIRLLRYSEDLGRRVYERSLQFILILSIRKLFPGARVIARYSLGPGVYFTVEKMPELSPEDVDLIEKECRRIVDADIPLIRRRLDIDTAIDFFTRDGQHDKAKLLRWRKFSYFDVYQADDYMDYFYGEMAPSTGYCKVFHLKYLKNALVMLMPCDDDPDRAAVYKRQPKLAAVLRQSDDWGKLMTCSTVYELNERVKNGSIRELIRVNEALHEKTYAELADNIVRKKSRAVMVAGPSSSGKTTSANRIATQLRVLGQDPVMLSLDDYYIDRDKLPVGENGQVDLEHIDTLDISRFNRDLESLVNGCQTEVPVFDFSTGKRSPNGRLLKLSRDQQLIIEGIHGLNKRMISPDIPPELIYRVYVSALTTLNLDDHNRIRTTDVRLLRRLVRDFRTRNASMEATLSMWPSVRRGEWTWIFPFQEEADSWFNTTLVYELAVLKKYVYPLLLTVPKESQYYINAHIIVKFLNYILDADVEDEIPPTSILREFIGGNTFYK
ncbi:MAG: Uridine kinase [Firmicutes bacterium ADurb.Bin182]|nr:MAG: Uridine kinase [Firmicutes bacterium ADurb.Bin182]